MQAIARQGRRRGRTGAASAGRRHPLRRAGLLLLPMALLTAGASPSDESPLSPLLDVVVLDRQILAIHAESGGETAERLEIGERVLYAKQRGAVGVAVTDRRMLAVATSSGSWQEARYLRGESPPGDVTLGDRVALFLTADRALGFDGKSGNLIEATLGPNESLVDAAVGANIVVVVTSRRVLGLSANHGGFFEARLRVGEQIDDISAQANTAVLHTSKRLLIFRGPTASWDERRLPVH